VTANLKEVGDKILVGGTRITFEALPLDKFAKQNKILNNPKNGEVNVADRWNESG